MTVSVLIPAYNSEHTIGLTLDSALRQTHPPDEILVMDDGSVDNTASIVRSYKHPVVLLQQANMGAAAARNRLCAAATGDLIALLDSDDVWHPRYLEMQLSTLNKYPRAAAVCTGHVVFDGWSDYDWEKAHFPSRSEIEVLDSVSFLRRYSKSTGFVGTSFCCVPRRTLTLMGTEPFRVTGAEDLHFFWLAALAGPIIFSTLPLAGYRMTSGSLSSDRLRTFRASVEALECLEKPYMTVSDRRLRRVYSLALASSRRTYARHLMSAGNKTEAVMAVKSSFADSLHPLSLAKSLRLLALTMMPPALQPTWPSVVR